jgi:hypothetical protein
MAKMIRAIPKPSEERKAEDAERIRILADLDNPSSDVDSEKQKYLNAFNNSDSLRTKIERRIRLFIYDFRHVADCTITQAEHDMHMMVLNHMVDEHNRIITELDEKTEKLTDWIRTTEKSIRETVDEYGEEVAKQRLDADRQKLNDFLLQQENAFKNAYAATQWKPVRDAIQDALLLPEKDIECPEPEKALYRRLRKWIGASQLAAIREKFLVGACS